MSWVLALVIGALIIYFGHLKYQRTLAVLLGFLIILVGLELLFASDISFLTRVTAALAVFAFMKPEIKDLWHRRSFRKVV